MKATVKATESKVSNKVVNKGIESKKIDLLKAVKVEAVKNEIIDFNELIKSINDIDKLNELKIQISFSKIENKDKLSLKKLINTKVFNLKIENVKNEILTKNKDIKPLTEKQSFKIQVSKNLMNLNNIVKAIKIEDKERFFEGKKVESKYKFLFSREFTNSIFYSFLNLRQFSKLAINDDIFNHSSVIENCERIMKLDSINLEIRTIKGKQIFDLLKDENKTFEQKIVEFTKL